MDTKLTSSNTISAKSSPKHSKGRAFFVFVEALKEELKKVSWPTLEELKFSTKVVIASVFIFGFGIYFFDLIIRGVLDSFALIVRFIFG